MSADDFDYSELRQEFLSDVILEVETCEESFLKLDDPNMDVRKEEIAKIFRLAHSIKGAGAAVGLTELAKFAHVVEDCLAILRSEVTLIDQDNISILLKAVDAIRMWVQTLSTNPEFKMNVESLTQQIKALTKQLNMCLESISDPNFSKSSENKAELANQVNTKNASLKNEKHNASIKIDAERIDNVLNLIGELVVSKSLLSNSIEKYASDVQLSNAYTLIDKTIRELQDRTLSMRMTPLKGLFIKMQRIVRDVSQNLGKNVELILQGEETEIDRTMVDLLNDPLTHIIRNALDHGVEDAATRQSLGKNPTARLYLTATSMSGRIILNIKDDGRGIDPQKIYNKAVEKKLISPVTDINKMSNKEVYGLLFLPGFSTAEKVTDLSGRGVGLDVVKTNIEKLNGQVEIQSELGKGSNFEISLPLTTSITNGLLMKLENTYYIMPIHNVKEILLLDQKELIHLESGEVALNHRDGSLPLTSLRQINFLKNNFDSLFKPQDMIVIVESSGKKFGIAVETVLHQVQVVLKPLGGDFKTDRGIAGGAILGNGNIALILDPAGLKIFFEGTDNEAAA